MQAHWLILKNNEKATSSIYIPYFRWGSDRDHSLSMTIGSPVVIHPWSGEIEPVFWHEKLKVLYKQLDQEYQ